MGGLKGKGKGNAPGRKPRGGRGGAELTGAKRELERDIVK